MLIKTVTKDKKHFNKVVLDNGRELLIDADTCLDLSLKEGREISEEEIEQSFFDSQYKRAKSRALWYLDRMDYTEKALFDKLIRAGFAEKAVSAVLGRLCELGVIDDRRFAERLAERLKENNISKREAVQKMLLKGVPLCLAKEVIEAAECDEGSQIMALLEGKYSYKLTLPNGQKKVFDALIRKGFSYGEVRQAMKNYINELEFSED